MKNRETTFDLSNIEIYPPEVGLGGCSIKTLKDFEQEIAAEKFNCGFMNIVSKLSLVLGSIAAYGSIHPSPEELRWVTIPVGTAMLLISYLLPPLFIAPELELIQKQSQRLQNLIQNQNPILEDL